MSTEEQNHSNIVALGYQKTWGGEVTVTDVLTYNFPELTRDELRVFCRLLEKACQVRNRVKNNVTSGGILST